MYNENNRGTKIDPWGTPQVRWAAMDEWAPKLTEKLLFDRKNLNHFSSIPVMPKERSRWDQKESYGPQSQTASSNLLSAASVVIKMSLKTFKREDLVLSTSSLSSWNSKSSSAPTSVSVL